MEEPCSCKILTRSIDGMVQEFHTIYEGEKRFVRLQDIRGIFEKLHAKITKHTFGEKLFADDRRECECSGERVLFMLGGLP